MKPLVSLVAGRPLEAAAEFKVGLGSAPYLADHGFQDMIVLPGSFYVDMALRVEHELAHGIPIRVRNVAFRNPIILSGEDTVIKVKARDRGDGWVEYSFYEGGSEEGAAQSPHRQVAASLEVERSLSRSDGERIPRNETSRVEPLNRSSRREEALTPCAKNQNEPPHVGSYKVQGEETARGSATSSIAIETFQGQAQAEIGAELFYQRLRENGNQYGPHFQKVSTIWRAGDQCLGLLSVPRRVEPHQLHPSLLDSITQLLASFIMEKGKTFVLRAIEKIEIADFNFPDALWGHATLLAKDRTSNIQHPTSNLEDSSLAIREGDRESDLAGNIRVFDPSGKAYLELSGVAFTLLDRADTAAEKTPANLVIAANFTAEPLEDSLNFWGDHFDVPIRAEFAPYNQVFQQLLDAGSAFGRNREGVNAILLGLEEWANSSPHPMRGGRPGEISPKPSSRLEPLNHGAPPLPALHPAQSGGKNGPAVTGSGEREDHEGHAGMAPDRETAERCFGDRSRYILPNGLEIVHLNQYETDYVYQEIFEDECYLRHGIRLQDGDTVVDIGANIGLFSLFVLSRCKNPKIYAFEPAPVVYDLLKANCAAHGSNARAVNAGVSDKARSATFTFYEKSSVFSGFHADETEDRTAIQTVVRNMLNGESVAGDSVDEYVHELTADRLRGTTCECQLTSVSDIIRENRIDTIQLLKIDAEKSELDILKGIADGDWPKISQIVMEIHDRTGEAVKRIEELLSGKGYHCAVEHEKLLEHSGLFNLYATRGPRTTDREKESVVSSKRSVTSDQTRSGLRTPDSGLHTTILEFCTALRSFMQQAAAPLVLCVCPRAPAVETNEEMKAALNDAEQTLLAEAGTIPNVHTIGSAKLLRRYPVKDYYDPQSHELGHIPYTPEGYGAIGTALFRTIFNLKRRPFKVIALDCDNTLWKGVCGEEGPLGIEMTEPYRGLQEFMIDQMKAGMLLCLCSKNNEKDVLDVFAQRSDMPLKREHVVSWRINWSSKSENLKSLARELNLGLDSFIFVDDNPVECAEVRINCPGVLALQLPRDAESFPSFLDHLWAFDHSGSTEEDHKRTRMYLDSVQREQFRERSLSLKDYVKGLQLRVEISEAAEDQLGRVSQLTFRTNQFNFTTIRRSEKAIRDFLNREGAHCLVVRVADRFGDYGLVGAVLYEANADRFKVDTLLLSCRVLGRGVEHAVVSHLGRCAAGEGKQFVELTCLPTEKNQPAREFIAGIGDRYQNDGSTSWTFPAEHLASAAYDPDQATTNQPEETAIVHPEKRTPNRAWDFDVVELPERLQRIGEEWCETSRLAKAIEAYRLRREASTDPLIPALFPTDGRGENALPAALLNIWRKVMGRPRIGMDDNFFEVGGTSLRAVQVIATIKKELKRTLSIVDLFECPTVALLADRLGAASGEVRVETTPAGAALRGQQRRHKTMRRKAA